LAQGLDRTGRLPAARVAGVLKRWYGYRRVGYRNLGT
jgi:hypothetical protein